MFSMSLTLKSVCVNRRNKDGYTCWMKAMEAVHFDTFKLLIKSGKEINKEIKSCKEPTNRKIITTSVTETFLPATFNVNAILSFIELDAHDTEHSLRVALFERDLNSVRHLLDYGIVHDKLYKNGKVIIEFPVDVARKPCEQFLMREIELIIIRKFLNDSRKFCVTSCFRDNKVFTVAVHIGSCELVELLCQYIANSNIRKMTTQYMDVIMTAAEKCRCDLMKDLINYESTYNCFDRKRLNSATETALTNCKGNYEKLLMGNRVTVDVESVLIFAITLKWFNSLRFLIDKCSNFCRSVVSNKCKSLFHKAIKLGDICIINTLIDLGSDVNCLVNGKTPLMNAETPKVMDLLIKRGATVKQAENQSKLNLLSHVILRELKKCWPRIQTSKQENKEKLSPWGINLKGMLEILLRNGANVNDTDSSGRTPLMAAAKQFHGGYVLKVLLEAGAEVNKADCNGVTALHDAVNSRCLKNVKILIKAGADVNKKNNEGCTALHQAIHNEDILKCLLHHGADVNAEDASGNTALLLAVISKSFYNKFSLEVLRSLLEAGANANHRNKTGETALMKAGSSLKASVIKILCESNADVNLRSLDNTRDAISSLIDRLCHLHITRGYVCDSIFDLIDRGARSSCVSLQNLYYFIRKGCLTIVQRLAEAGLGPSDVFTAHLEEMCTDTFRATKISPFSFALLCNQVTMAIYFSDIWYLTISDVSTLGHDKDVRRHLTSQDLQESLKFLEEFSSTPISLQKLSFVTVSTLVGTGPEREGKVRGLPLPNILKDKLLFSAGLSQELQFGDVKSIK